MWPQLLSIYTCNYCDRIDRCYYISGKFICTEAFKYLPNLALINYVLNKVCDDVRTEIMTRYILAKHPCVLSKQAIINKRNVYRNVDFELLNLKDLQELTKQRCPNIKLKRTRVPKYYHDLLNKDKYDKINEWRYDRYFKDF